MLLNKSISINSATTTVIIPAVAGLQVFVKRLVLESDISATHTIQIQDTAGGNKTGAMPLAVGNPLIVSMSECMHSDGWFVTAPGLGLQIVTTGATVLVVGEVWWIQP